MNDFNKRYQEAKKILAKFKSFPDYEDIEQTVALNLPFEEVFEKQFLIGDSLKIMKNWRDENE